MPYSVAVQITLAIRPSVVAPRQVRSLSQAFGFRSRRWAGVCSPRRLSTSLRRIVQGITGAVVSSVR